MIKKISKKVLIIILAILLIVFSKIDSYALTRDDRPTLKAGDKFKIVNNSYEYKNFKVAWAKNYKQDESGLYLKSGDIVEWTGEEDSDASIVGSTKFLYKVKKDNKIFWMIQENLTKYKVQVPARPATLSVFISKYGIKASMTDEEFNKIYQGYVNNAINHENEYSEELINTSKTHVNEQIDTSGKTAEEIKSELEAIYKEYSNSKSNYYITPTESDYRFMAESYYLSIKYLKAETISKEYGDSESAAEKFDKAVKNYNNTDSVTEKDAAYTVIEEEWKKLSEDEKKGRQKKYNDVTKKEAERTKQTYEDRDGQYKGDDKKNVSESIYQYPGQSQNKTSAAGSLDDMIGDADKFINNAGDSPISSQSLQDFSKKFYNIFLTIGVIISVLVGSVLGIKFMIGGAEEKAHIKELLVPYVVGCIAIFGAFAIWKIVVTILSNSFL